MRLKILKRTHLFQTLLLFVLAFTNPGFDALAREAVDAEKSGKSPESNEPANKEAAVVFDLLEIRVKGNTLLEKKQLERTIYPFLGPKKSVDTVEEARSALEKLYQTQGYQTVSVDIPEQNVENGTVYLQVVQGKISRLRVKDAHYFSLGKIKAGIPELAEGNVPNFPKMQQQLAALGGQNADRKIQPILRAGETPGTLEVDLKVKDALPFHGKVELNGRNTSSTSRLRLVTTLHYDNLWQAMHSASLMYQVSPINNKEVDVWAGTYVLPLFDTDSKLALYAVSSSSNAQIASAGALSVLGIGKIYGARLVKPLPSLSDYFHSATLGIDYKDFKEDLKLLGSDSIRTPIAYTPFLAQYSGTARGKESLTSFDLGLHFSVRGLGNDQTQFENKRFLARADYMYLTGDLKTQHNLPHGMELKSHFSGQVADSPLISNEQYSLGGAQSVRGYFETQALADNGVFGSFELHSPHLGLEKWDLVNNLKLLAFIEGGKGWINKALSGNAHEYTLASGGIGLHFQLWKLISGTFDVGVPFKTLGVVKSGDPKLHFSIVTEF